MTAHVELHSVRVENLRGYSDARLAIGRLRVLVGDNNQGKSGLLRLTAWLLNDAPEDLLSGARTLTPDEASFLLPANQTSGRARRLTLKVGLVDRRHARRYGAEEVDLRVSFQRHPARARLNLGLPARDEEHDQEAMTLLRLLRRKIRFLLVPSVRDGASGRFQASWASTLYRVFLSRFRQDQPGGTATEYRRTRTFLAQVVARLPTVQQALRERVAENLPPGMLRDVSLHLRATPADLSEWLGSRLDLRLSTGQHDSNYVAPSEVGNGLQSLLDLSLGLAEHLSGEASVQVIAAVEEPEAFLHPSGQRGTATSLRKLSQRPNRSVIITTHSPYFVDESEYGEVVLVRDHHFYEAAGLADPQRRDINTALMSTAAAEVFFSGGVLLVEGPGEVAFFKTLLARLRIGSAEPRLARLTVMEVGGKARFAPWWRLIRSYGIEGDRPIRSLSVFDADAASVADGERAALRAIRDTGLNVSAAARARVEEFGDLAWTAVAQREREARAINDELAEIGVSFFSVDLEWATFGGLAHSSPDLVGTILGVPGGGDRSPAALAGRAGSKVNTGHSDRRFKKPHLRQQLAQAVALDQLPAEIRTIMRRWVGLAGLTNVEQGALLP